MCAQKLKKPVKRTMPDVCYCAEVNYISPQNHIYTVAEHEKDL